MRRTRPTGPSNAPARARMLPAAVPLLALALALAGCGIRTTTVPVDAGPAPSRASCALPEATGDLRPDTAVLKIYLVCSMQAAPVPRNVPLRPGPVDRLELVAELMAQLQRPLPAAESRARFVTEVPGSLVVEGPRRGDPAGALRLNEKPADLPSFALAQIVCTLVANDAAPGDTVILGGNGLHDTLRGYTCTQDLRSRPDAADTAGAPVR
jgi:hypothetical protein